MSWFLVQSSQEQKPNASSLKDFIVNWEAQYLAITSAQHTFHAFQISSVQHNTYALEKPDNHALHPVSQKFPDVAFEQFQCSSDRRWPSLVLSRKIVKRFLFPRFSSFRGRSSSASSFHASRPFKEDRPALPRSTSLVLSRKIVKRFLFPRLSQN